MRCIHPLATGDFVAYELAKLAAQQLRAHPDFIQFALERLDRWRSKRPSSAYDEWETLIKTQSHESISILLESDTEEAQRLRSSSPFIREPFFSEQERLAVIKKVFGT